MKYWVYKESRILGPFDKEGVAGLPGVDEGTLVCSGDPAGDAWVPAGTVGLGTAAPPGSGLDELPSSGSLFDQLQIESSGLVGDDDFPGALAHDLFQDADYKKGFADLLSAGGPSSDDEARRAREKVSELTVQLEHLYRHIAQLEAGHTDLSRRLAEKNLELRQRGVAGESAPAPAVPESFAPAPADTTPPAPADWAQPGSLPPIFGDVAPPSKLVVPGVADLPATPEPPAPPAPPALPTEAAAPALPEIPAPKPQGFAKPKSFKVVPTAKSFKVVGATDAAAAPPPPTAAAPAPVEPPPPAPVAAPAPVIEPVAPPPPPPPPPAPEPVVVAPPAPTPAPIDFAPPAQSPFAPVEPPAATPIPPPPNTLSRSQEAPPVPDLGATAAAPFGEAAPPPETLARRGGAIETPAEAPPGDAVAARFAKPAPPETGEPKPARSNKKFYVAGGVLLALLLGVAVLFMRQPKDDLKQMASLDDGKPPVGLPADDGQAPPIAKPRMAEPEPAPAPAPPPGPSAEYEAAIAAVKDFPLDGGRGTVGRWLQYSYTASPGAGTEEWNASTTGENTILVEYRFVPAPGGSGRGALYLFELDGIGLVIGKNIEARQMLAGGPPPDEAPKKKPKPAKKKAVKRRPAVEEPKEVPLLPLPDSGELRPPAEDDGRFGSDTINSGI